MEPWRGDLLKIYHAALAAVHGQQRVRQFLHDRPMQGSICVVAIGKAAAAMMAGAVAALGASMRPGLVITKKGYADSASFDRAKVTVLESGHPLPDACSLTAGRALLEFIAAVPRDGQILFLISGGASSLVEVLPPEISLDELRRVNHWLLGSGWDIRHMNALRKGLSCIKGGRLAEYVQGRKVLQLLISDVPGDRVADIGSGMLAPDVREDLTWKMPGWIHDLVINAPPMPAASHPCFESIETHIIANLELALRAAEIAAQQLGDEAHIHTEYLSGDAAAVGRRLALELVHGAAGVHIWGGETTVELPDNPGRGGRNQHLALAAAEMLAGHDNVCLLAAGTDGSDGPGEDAGALVDGGTIARGGLDEYTAAECLCRADAGTFLEASGDLINTGPTGTNVMDIVIGLKQ